MRRLGFLTLFALLSLAGVSRQAKAGDFFYMMIFGSQSDPKQLRFSHTFATFVRATGEGTDPSTYALTWHTISWLPRNLDVRLRRFTPEPGINADLDSTMRIVMKDGEKVTMWGPYITSPQIYNRSIEVLNKLNSGKELYRAIDGPLNNNVSDCIHAVGDVDPQFGRRRYVLDKVGKPASAFVASQLIKRSHYDQSQFENNWIIPRLGLHQYPIEYVGSQGSARVPHFEVESFFSRIKLAHPANWPLDNL